MKKSLAFLAFCSPLSMAAQSYDALWKQVEKSMKNDLPQSALTTMQQIRTKAVAEKNEVQLLCSYLSEIMAFSHISRDSIDVAKLRLERQAKQATNPIMKALWLNALAKVKSKGYERGGDEPLPEAVQAAKDIDELYLQSIADLSLLANARAKDYLPLFEEGAASEAFQHDLLHVLTYKEIGTTLLSDSLRFATYGRLADFYASRNRSASVLFRLRQWEGIVSGEYRFPGMPTKREAEAVFLALKREAERLPELLDVYLALTHLYLSPPASELREEEREAQRVEGQQKAYACIEEALAKLPNHSRIGELKNIKEDLTAPYARIFVEEEGFLPQKPLSFQFALRNVNGWQLRLRRLSDMPLKDFMEKYQGRRSDYEALLPLSEIVAGSEQSLSTDAATPYLEQQKKVTFAGVREGIYLLELSDGKKVVTYRHFSVSGVTAIGLYTSSEKRFTLVNAQTGQPLSGGTLTEVVNHHGEDKKEVVREANAQGEIRLPGQKENSISQHFPATATDAFGAPLSNLFYADQHTEKESRLLNLTTDRIAYRPGQKLQCAVLFMTGNREGNKVLAGEKVRLFLKNANYQVVDSAEVTTDEFGIASTTFVLPEVGLWGEWVVHAKSEKTSRIASILVEEYKRHSLYTTFAPVQKEYAANDVVDFVGKLQTYTQVGIGGAKVSYKMSPYFKHVELSAEEGDMQGETTTDADGNYRFSLRLPAVTATDRFSGIITVTITAPNGETTEEVIEIQADNYRSRIDAEWEQVLCKEDLSPFTIYQRAASEANIPAKGQYEFRQKGVTMAKGTFETGVPFTPHIKKLAAGRYEVITSVDLTAHPGYDATKVITQDTTTVFLFSEKDKRIRFNKEGKPIPHQEVRSSYAHEINIHHSDDFLIYKYIDKKGTLHVFLASGTPLSTVFYDIVADERIVRAERLPVTDKLTHLKIDYQDEWKTHAEVIFTFVKDGKLRQHHTTLERPLKKPDLVFRWKTFRSTLTPGQKEEWTLRVNHSDGRPAKASVLAGMYDASLDALERYSLDFALPPISYSTTYQVEGRELIVPYFFYTPQRKYRKITPQKFTTWDNRLFYAFAFEDPQPLPRFLAGEVKGVRVAHEQEGDDILLQKRLRNEVAPAPLALHVGEEEDYVLEDQYPELRTNFAETAFFFPSLRTNEKGEATLSFQLPQSTTTWRFYALAHTADMDYVQTDTTVVARKEFSLTPALPRFFREGDRTELPATLHNLTSKAQRGAVTLVLLDAVTMKELRRESQHFDIAAGAQAHFSFFVPTPEETSGVVVRMIADGQQFSDGEEHLLPVLSARETVVQTLPFVLHGPSSLTLPLTALWHDHAQNKQLVVETTGNALWQVAAALPFVYEVSPKNALDWAAQYHAMSLAAHLVEQVPELSALTAEDDTTTAAWSERLRQNSDLRAMLLHETPWSPLANEEAERTRKLRTLFQPSLQETHINEAIEKLRSLRDPKTGGWSWYPGMHSSYWTTLTIVRYLLEIRQQTGRAEGEDLIKPALTYLEKVVMAGIEKQHRSEPYADVEYLYVRALAKELGVSELPPSTTPLLQAVKQRLSQFDMYKKAHATLALSILGKHKEAALAMKSILEHTVHTPEMGRYFDAKYTPFSSSQLAIGTQVATIAALHRLQPQSPALQEMQLWLLQNKRSRHWATRESTMQACHALLFGSPASSFSLTAEAQPLHVVARQHGSPLPNPTTAAPRHPQAGLAAYGRASYDASATEVTVEKTDKGLAWGSVYAISSVPITDRPATASGMAVERSLLRKTAQGWQPLQMGETVERGALVRIVYTLSAQQNFDFVALRSPRPVGMVATSPLSGYEWGAMGSMYRVVRDASTDYFIEHLPKGKYTYVEEVRTDRAGEFTLAPARLQSVYAPEFVGYSRSDKVSIAPRKE